MSAIIGYTSENQHVPTLLQVLLQVLSPPWNPLKPAEILDLCPGLCPIGRRPRGAALAVGRKASTCFAAIRTVDTGLARLCSVGKWLCLVRFSTFCRCCLVDLTDCGSTLTHTAAVYTRAMYRVIFILTLITLCHFIQSIARTRESSALVHVMLPLCS